jgi:hypothetical protein
MKLQYFAFKVTNSNCPPPAPNSKFISPTPLCLSYILRCPVALKNPRTFLNVNCDNTIFFYTGYWRLEEYTSKLIHICHLSSLQNTTILSLFVCELWTSEMCILFWTLYIDRFLIYFMVLTILLMSYTVEYQRDSVLFNLKCVEVVDHGQFHGAISVYSRRDWGNA